jgi:hypothetical protein
MTLITALGFTCLFIRHGYLSHFINQKLLARLTYIGNRYPTHMFEHMLMRVYVPIMKGYHTACIYDNWIDQRLIFVTSQANIFLTVLGENQAVCQTLGKASFLG